MDWLKSSFQAAQKQAEEAAARVQEKTRALIDEAQNTNLVQQAKVFAEQATEKAKIMATHAAEEASAKLKDFTATVQPEASSSGRGFSQEELKEYGVTPGLMETVAGMSYSTFSDYPMDALPTTNPLGLSAPIPPPSWRLTPWQERHGLLVIQSVDNLNGLRFALCPKRMTDELFWIIYFTLVKTLLPPIAFAPAPFKEVAPSTSTMSTTASKQGAHNSHSSGGPATAATGVSEAGEMAAAAAAAASNIASVAKSLFGGRTSSSGGAPRGAPGSAAAAVPAGAATTSSSTHPTAAAAAAAAAAGSATAKGVAARVPSSSPQDAAFSTQVSNTKASKGQSASKSKVSQSEQPPSTDAAVLSRPTQLATDTEAAAASGRSASSAMSPFGTPKAGAGAGAGNVLDEQQQEVMEQAGDEESDIGYSSSVSLNDEDLDNLNDELEDDPELAAYLQEALEADEGEDGDDDEGNSALDDLDDYIAHLDDELAGSDRDESASTGGALTARDGVENSPAPRLRSEGVEAASEASVGSEQGGGDEDVDGLLNGLENSEEEEAKDRTVKL